MRILIRATNWLGDAVMSLPALRAVKANYPKSTVTLLVRRSLADLYARESCVDKVITYDGNRWNAARMLRKRKFHLGILFPNSFDSALIFRLAGIPDIVGYDCDIRRLLLTRPIKVPRWKGTVHERFYYLELLQEARVIDGYHAGDKPIVLDCATQAAALGRQSFVEQGIPGNVIGVSPGAAYGNAKRWLSERFAESAAGLASRLNGTVIIFGAPNDAAACAAVEQELQRRSIPVVNLAGKTTLRQFIDLTAACSVFLTNDSGSMHVASALAVPTVAIFGATNPKTTGPGGPSNAIVQEKVDCSPCLKRECPIDHRCMTRVTSQRVIDIASALIQLGKVETGKAH
jgi:heptosyltransferase-2